MSLLGSELEATMESDRRIVGDGNDQPTMDYLCHPPVTPPRPTELLFFGDLNTQNISAAALAQQIHTTAKQSSWTGTSVATDDFQTAAGSDDDLDFPSPVPLSSRSSDTLTPFADDDSDIDSYQQIFQKDILSQIHPVQRNDDTFQDTMSTTMKPTPVPAGSKKFVPQDAPDHVDAAEKVYDTAKGVWAWGKGVAVLSPFLGLAEASASKAVSMTGNSLESLDGAVLDQIHGLDESVLNPAIKAIVSALLNAAGGAEDFLKPVVIGVLKPLGLIKDTAENPEMTPTSTYTA